MIKIASIAAETQAQFSTRMENLGVGRAPVAGWGRGKRTELLTETVESRARSSYHGWLFMPTPVVWDMPSEMTKIVTSLVVLTCLTSSALAGTQASQDQHVFQMNGGKGRLSRHQDQFTPLL